MHSFDDPFGIKFEQSLLSRLDYPFYLALACYLINELCKEKFHWLS